MHFLRREKEEEVHYEDDDDVDIKSSSLLFLMKYEVEEWLRLRFDGSHPIRNA